MTVDEAIYRNITHLLEINGISERNCLISCGLNFNFFSNYRSKKTKHFRVCDIACIAELFDVSIDYLCQYKNSKEEFFVKKYKLRKRDEKVLLRSFRKLDGVSRISVAEIMNQELEHTKLREKQRKAEKKN